MMRDINSSNKVRHIVTLFMARDKQIFRRACIEYEFLDTRLTNSVLQIYSYIFIVHIPSSDWPVFDIANIVFADGLVTRDQFY